MRYRQSRELEVHGEAEGSAEGSEGLWSELKKTANDAIGPALKLHTHVTRYLRHRVLSLYTLPLKLLDV